MKIYLLGISASLLFMSSLAVAGEWIKDPINDCEVWNEEPSSGGDVISWSGECEDGKASGHGVLAWFTDGALLARRRLVAPFQAAIRPLNPVVCA